ncbi:MAG: HypC/HybG/HupF family hydrogenase formation chaperone [Armatimonadota bacterium]|nr:HypC/HybG/HupF family hydrogenase formation chaperone [Armatimonadota bacterium]MDR7519056.1 HypC/HybG/HupF family hydrogenase formation chaperone [Armatimonadota bacterium]MDR7551157.1 HypC/HybG/HupF family hydrogenase formation chaperone [Armatimonadota bacterium]
MCLALPYRIVTLLGPGRARAQGPYGLREISTGLLEAPEVGTYVLVAYGSAIREIDADEAAEILAVWDALWASEPSPS